MWHEINFHQKAPINIIVKTTNGKTRVVAVLSNPLTVLVTLNQDVFINADDLKVQDEVYLCTVSACSHSQRH